MVQVACRSTYSSENLMWWFPKRISHMSKKFDPLFFTTLFQVIEVCSHLFLNSSSYDPPCWGLEFDWTNAKP